MATILFVLPHNSALVNNLLYKIHSLASSLKRALGNWLMSNIMFDKFEICSQKKHEKILDLQSNFLLISAMPLSPSISL